MLADYFTKLLQGKLFKKYRAVIMGWEPISTLWLSSGGTATSDSKERVGQSSKNMKNNNIGQTGHKKTTYVDAVRSTNARMNGS